jgi:formylglycine-generating enzyme required for sulfatase activity
VSIIFTLKDVDEAIEGLNYKNETTLKFKLLFAIRNSYLDESSIQSLQSIDTEELVRSVWETGDDLELIKNKRKNFSSLKSSINSDLKKLYSRGKNPQGIIINHINVFDISDEAKNKALASITDVLREKGIDTSSRITEILAAVGDILAGAISSANQEDIQEEINRLKSILSGLAEKTGLSAPGVDKRDKGGADQTIGKMADGAEGRKTAGKKETTDDKGLAGGIAEKYQDKAYGDICALLKNKEIDAATRMNGIMETLNGILSTAINSVGTELDSAEADQIKNLVSGLAGKTGLATAGETAPQGTGAGSGSEDRTGFSAGAKTTAETLERVSLTDAPGGTAADIAKRLKDYDEKGKDATGKGGLSDGNKAAVIAGILQEEGTDAAGKAGKIMAAMNEMLANIVAGAGAGLDAEETDRIKNIFDSFAQKVESASGAGEKLDEARPEVSAEDTEVEIIEELTEAGAEEIVEVVEEAAEDEIQPVAQETIADGGTEGYLPADLEEVPLEFAEETQKTEDVLAADETVEIIEEISSDELSVAAADEGITQAEERGFETTGAQTEVETLDKVSPTVTPGGTAEDIDKRLTDYDEKGKDATGRVGLSDDNKTALIAGILQEEGIDAAGKASKIMAAINEMLADAVAGTASTVAQDEIIAGVVTEDKSESGAQETEAADKVDYEEVIETADSVTEIVEALPEEDLASLSLESVPEETIAAEPGMEEEIIAADFTIETTETLSDDFPIMAEMPAEPGAGEETVVDDSVEEITETLPADYAAAEEVIADTAEVQEEIDVIEEVTGDEIEEIIEEPSVAGSGEGFTAAEGKTADTAIDGDLRTKAEFLAELAEAAKALEKLGPDLSNSIYSEEEIKGKAKLLSEEFDRYLSVREKFYNQHILIKSGDYLVGGLNREKDKFPEQIVYLHDFYIGKFPVTNALFEIFVEKTGYITTAEKYGFGTVYTPRMQKVKNNLTSAESFIWNSQLQYKKIPGACWYRPSGPESTLYIKRTHPVVQVSLEDACAFAAWTGKRIPTEKEWEASARTFHSHIYPWGSNWRDNACNLEKSLFGDTTPVDQFLDFSNDFEVADTLGNTMEWTLDPWTESPAGEDDAENYVVKGASWISDSPSTLTDRQPIYKHMTSNILGFRCIAI